MDIKTILRLSESAKQKAQFLINTKLLLKFSYTTLFLIEKNFFDIDIRETKAKKIW